MRHRCLVSTMGDLGPTCVKPLSFFQDGYFEGLKSDFADMKNTGPRWGGAITAALFLQKFIDKEVAWAHLDIAGPAWAEKAKGLNGVGGTGAMVRTLTDFVCKG